jgi:hypothetical protein
MELEGKEMKSHLCGICLIIALVGLAGCGAPMVKRNIPFEVFTQDPSITGLQTAMPREEALEVVRNTCSILLIGNDIRVTPMHLTWLEEDKIIVKEDARSNTLAFFSYKKEIRFSDVGMIRLTELHDGEEGPAYGWWVELFQIGVAKKNMISYEGHKKLVKQNPQLFPIIGGEQKRTVKELKSLTSGAVFFRFVSFPTDEAREIKDRFLAALLVLCTRAGKVRMVETSETWEVKSDNTK